MKKLLYSAVALATLLFASCQQENLEPAAGGSQVTFTVESPEAIQTKATIADGTNVNELIYEVWFTPSHGNLEPEKNAQKLYQGRKLLQDGQTKWTLTLDLVNDQKFTVLFWAQVEGTGVYNTEKLTAVTYNKLAENAESFETLNANDENLAAFYAVAYVDDAKHVKYENGEMVGTNGTVTLHRPFAQVNLGTLNTSAEYTVVIEKSKMTLSNVPTTFNVVNSEVSGSVEMAFKLNGVPSNPDKLPGFENYWYAGMNYVFAGDNITVEYDIQTRLNGGVEATVNNIISNVPLKENYRTNIIGNLLTSKTDYEIVVDPAFYTNENSGTIEVVGEGIVKNQNGDYEVTNADGLAYALTNLFNEDGNFYLLKDIDMTGVPFTSPTIPAGVTVNIYGEVPVVTRAATSVGSVTITGLTQPLIAKVEGAVTVSGLDIPAAENPVSVLVEEVAEDAAVTISDVEVTTVANSGAEFIVAADAVKTFDQLKKALLSSVNVITLAGNISSEEYLPISRSITIDGADYTFSSSASRIIRITADDVDVVLNNIKFASSAVRVGQNDIRGVSLDASLSNVSLTMNACSVDFTDSSANDWSYAVNVSGNGTGHKITVNGGTYESANVINVNGAKNTVIVKNAVLNSLYPKVSGYDNLYGACIWVVQKQDSKVYAEGNTFNGTNAVAFNIGETDLEERNNTDNTSKYAVTTEDDATVVTFSGTYDLPAAIGNESGKSTIKFVGNGTTSVLKGAVNANGNHPGNYANGKHLVFENLTYETANNGYNGGFGHAVSVTFINCKVVGQYYAHSEAPHTFTNCTIDPLNGYLYTYGSDCTFEGCKFEASQGKALQVYEDGAPGQNTVTISNCSFVAAKQATTWDGKPVTGIDINSNGAKFTVNINNCTSTGFPVGLNSNSDLWNVKDAGKKHADVYVDGAQVWFSDKNSIVSGLYKDGDAYYVSSAAALKYMNNLFASRKAGQNVVMNIVSDIDFKDYTWTPVDSHVDFGCTLAEINGNDHTISNMTINGQAMFTRFAGLGDVVVKNITFDNATVNSNGAINTSILTVQSYQNVLLDNVDVRNSTITGGYKVAPLIATVYNENPSSTITATLKNCDVENVTVKATSYDFCTTGMVAFVYASDNDKVEFENCTVSNVRLYAPNVYTAHAAIYTTGSETLFNEAEGVTVSNVTFENI